MVKVSLGPVAQTGVEHGRAPRRASKGYLFLGTDEDEEIPGVGPACHPFIEIGEVESRF